MTLTEYSASLQHQQQNTNTSSFSRPYAIDFTNYENGHQILSNSVSNSSTNSNTSASNVLSNENGCTCPTLPKSFIDNKSSYNEPKIYNDGHQCLKPALAKHPLLYQHQQNTHQSNTNHSPLSPLSHFTHQHLHHLQQSLNRSRPESNLLINNQHQFKPLCRTQNINNFSKLNDNLHRKIEYTGSSSSSSGCVSASSSSHYFPSNNNSSNLCSPQSGPQTPQSSYVQSPLAQSFTTDSGLCLSIRSTQSANSNATINNLNSTTDLTNDSMVLNNLSQKLLNNKNDKFELSDESKQSNKIKSNDNTIKKLELVNNNKKINNHKLVEQKSSFLNLPTSAISKKKDSDNESLLSDYSKDLSSQISNCTTNYSNLSNSINATSTTNLVSIGQNQHSTITAKPSLPAASSSFFHYPNIYNPLKTSKNNAKNNKKLIRFMTVCAYVLSVSLVAILLSLYYLFVWSPYTRNGNFTRTYINSEILFIEKTNYYDVDLSDSPSLHVIGSSPNKIHLNPNVKVNLNQTVLLPLLPLAASESNQESIERFGGTFIGSNSVSNQGNSDEIVVDNSMANSNGIINSNLNNDAQTYNLRSELPITLELKRSENRNSSPATSSSYHPTMMDSDQSNYSSENYQQNQPKFLNFLQQTQSNRLKKDRYMINLSNEKNDKSIN